MDSPTPALTFAFTAPVLFDPDVADGYMKHYLPLPDAVGAALVGAGVTHVEGTLAGHPFRRVVHERARGSLCLKFGRTWLDNAGVPLDALLDVTLAPDPDPSRIDLPEELASALFADPTVLDAWSLLSISMQKTLAYHVERAKRAETRTRRALAIVADLRAGRTMRTGG